MAAIPKVSYLILTIPEKPETGYKKVVLPLRRSVDFKTKISKVPTTGPRARLTATRRRICRRFSAASVQPAAGMARQSESCCKRMLQLQFEVQSIEAGRRCKQREGEGGRPEQAGQMLWDGLGWRDGTAPQGLRAHEDTKSHRSFKAEQMPIRIAHHCPCHTVFKRYRLRDQRIGVLRTNPVQSGGAVRR